MMPEKTAIAAKDVKAKVMMPIHWGCFTLAMHASQILLVQKQRRRAKHTAYCPYGW